MPFGHSTISLFETMLNARVGQNLEIIFTKRDSQASYQKFQFGPFVVASVEPDGGRYVVIAIQFSKVFIENYEFLKDGTLGPKTSSGWDYVENKTWGGF
jgi:hypothetical protein